MISCNYVNKLRPFPGSNEVQVSVSTFKDRGPEQADFAVVYNSPLIGAGPYIALFQKLIGGEPSD